MTESEKDAQARWNGRKAKRVLDGEALLKAFMDEHKIKSKDLARSLMAIESHRPLGLDTWDDAAGMSELEKRMFE